MQCVWQGRKSYSSVTVLQEAINRGYQNRNYDTALRLIDAGADVNLEVKRHRLTADGSIIDTSISYQTPLYEAMEYVSYQNRWAAKAIPLVCALLKAGADPSIPARSNPNEPEDDNAFRLAIRSQNPELINAICSVLFEQNSLESLYNIILLTFESLEFNNTVNDTLLQYYQKDDWSCNLKQRAETHIDEINKVKDKGERVFENLIDMPYNLLKALNVIKERFPDALDLLPTEFSQPCLHDALTSTIRIYTAKCTQSFLSEVM